MNGFANCYGMNCVPWKYIRWSLDPQCDCMWRYGLSEIIKVKWGHKDVASLWLVLILWLASPIISIGVLIIRDTRALSFCYVRTHENVAIAGHKGSSPRHQTLLDFDLRLSSLWNCEKINVCCLSHAVCCVLLLPSKVTKTQVKEQLWRGLWTSSVLTGQTTNWIPGMKFGFIF